MKKTTKGIAVGAVAVCLLAGMTGSPKKAESLELSIPLSKDAYDINTDIPVEISVSPNGSAIDGLEYFTDSNTVTFTDSIINTGQTEGDYSFYVRAGDVESNILSIHVVDFTAQNEATRKAEEERLAKEAEEQKAAEEQAAQQAKEKTAAKQSANETVTDAPEADPVPAPQPVEEPVQIVVEQVQEVPVSGTAYFPQLAQNITV